MKIKCVWDLKNIYTPFEWTFNDASVMYVTNLKAIHGNWKQGKIFTVWYTLETGNKSYIYIAINDKTYMFKTDNQNFYQRHPTLYIFWHCINNTLYLWHQVPVISCYISKYSLQIIYLLPLNSLAWINTI